MKFSRNESFCVYLQFANEIVSNSTEAFVCGFPYTAQEASFDLFRWLEGKPSKLRNISYLHPCLATCDFVKKLKDKLEIDIRLIPIDCGEDND